MTRLEEIDRELSRLRQEYETVRGTETEVYTRIVGYYRSVKNWNKGKREEYRHRVTFGAEADTGNAADRKAEIRHPEPVASNDAAIEPEVSSAPDLTGIVLYYFFRKTCPNCPPVAACLEDTSAVVTKVDADTENGRTLAEKYGVYSTPTVIAVGSDGTERFRGTTKAAVQRFLDGLTKKVA
jgi:thiol-disulfide isomerase/thioredoxin